MKEVKMTNSNSEALTGGNFLTTALRQDLAEVDERAAESD